jgi:beta-lactamase regulating signal transducer with metallopeptidase domain
MAGHLNHIADAWWNWMFSMFWQVGLLIVLVAILDLLIRKWVWPQLRYALWLLVLVKLVLPPSLTAPTSLTSGLQPLAQEAIETQWQDSPPADVADSTKYSPPMYVLENDPGADSIPMVVPENPGPTITNSISTENVNLSAEATAGAEMNESNAPPVQPMTPPVKLHAKFYLMLVWILGIWIFAGWFLLHWRQLTRQVRKQSQIDKLPDWFFVLLRETADLLRLRRIPIVAVSSKIATPAVFGVFRPTLLMPTVNLDKLSRRDARHILLHELAHIKRRDTLVHTFNLVLQIVYWFNPLLWLVRKQVQHLRELCCDASVAKVLKENTMGYRETLLETAKRLLAKSVEPGLGLLGLFENSHRLVTRLKWLEKKTWKHSRIRLVAIVVVIAAVSACILPMAQGQRTAKDQTEDSINEMKSEEREVNTEGASEAQKAKNQFTATLPNGVTVTLEGICENPQTGPWWRPNGERWENLNKYPLDLDRPAVREEFYKAYEMFVSVITQGRRCPGRGQMPERWQIPQGHVGPGRKVPIGFSGMSYGALANTAILSSDLQQTTVRFALALGPWKTRIAIPPHEDLHYRFPLEVPGAGFTFYKSSQEETDSEGNKHTSIDVVVEDWQKTPLAYRVIAALKDGNVREDVYLSPHDTPLRQVQKGLLTYIFHRLPQKEIDHFELQSSPFQWVEFQNVSLQPGYKTSVQVVHGQEKPNDERMEITAENVQIKSKDLLMQADKMQFQIANAPPKPVADSRRIKDRTPKDQISIEAQFLRVPTKFISTLKLDLKTEKVEVDMEKGEVATSLLDPVQIDFLMRFCQASKETHILSSPNVITNAGETAEIFIGQDRPDSKFAQGIRMRVLPTLDNENHIRLDIQLSQKATRSTGDAEYAIGFYDNQVTLQARLQSGHALFTYLPEDFLTSLHDAKSAADSRTLMILKATILPTKKLPVVTQKPKTLAPKLEPLDTVQTDISSPIKLPRLESMYAQDRPWQWYLAMEELRNLQQKKIDWENKIQQGIFSNRNKNAIKELQQQYDIIRQQYEEALRKMRDLEELMAEVQELQNEIVSLNRRRDTLEEKILDTQVQLKVGLPPNQQSEANHKLNILKAQRDELKQVLDKKQEQLKAIHRQMN